jgi:hypothetical protein
LDLTVALKHDNGSPKSKKDGSCAVISWRTVHEARKGSLHPRELGDLLEALGAVSDTRLGLLRDIRIILSPENAWNMPVVIRCSMRCVFESSKFFYRVPDAPLRCLVPPCREKQSDMRLHGYWPCSHQHQVAIDKRASGVGRCGIVGGQRWRRAVRWRG